MNIPQIGRVRLVKKYLGFLVDDYHMDFCAEEIANTTGIEDPTYVYSFYNGYGCFSLLEIPQRGEWDCYCAERFFDDPHKRLLTKINQKSYINHSIFTARAFLKLTGKYIRNQIVCTNQFWGIQIQRIEPPKA